METYIRRSRQCRHFQVIRHLRHNDIDRTKWDTCIADCTCPLIYAESRYLDITAPGWDALVLGDYEAVFPLPHRSKWGFDYIFQPAFTQQLGAFGAHDATPFLRAIPSNFKLIDLQLNSGNSTSTGKLRQRPNLMLDLAHPIESLRKNYSENTRRNIRRSATEGFRTTTVPELSELVGLFRGFRGKEISMRPEDYRILERLHGDPFLAGRFETHALRNASGEMMAGALFLRSGHGWIFLFSAVHPEGRKTGAMSALIDGFIERHAGESTFLDFEGSSDPNLYRFYKSFGSAETVYLQLRINRLPFPFRLFKS